MTKVGAAGTANYFPSEQRLRFAGRRRVCSPVPPTSHHAPWNTSRLRAVGQGLDNMGIEADAGDIDEMPLVAAVISAATAA